MRPTFMGFESATRGLMANQKVLDIVGNNLGNIGVTGYTRQRVDLVSLGTNGRYARFSNKTTGLAGQGVHVNGVSQVRDPFLDKRFREQEADVGYYNKLSEVLTDIDSALDEVVPSPITDAIGAFQTAVKVMQEGGPTAVNSSAVRAAALNITQVFKQFDVKLSNVWEQQKFDLEVEVNAMNGIMKNIADMNGIIKKEVFNSSKPGNEYYGPNELLDQRNVLLDKLSGYGDIDIKQEFDGTVTVKMGDKVIIDGDRSESANLVTNTRHNTVTVNWQSTGKPISIFGGSLKASTEMLNGRGAEATASFGESFEKGISYYQDKIDIFAKVLAETFNGAIKEYEPENNLDGTPNPNAGKVKGNKTLFSFTPGKEGTAGGLVISNEWTLDAEYMSKNVNKPGEGNSDTAFLQGALDAFTKKLDFDEFKGSMNDYITFYSTANLGNQLSASKDRQEAAFDISNSLLDKIASISGVSQEEDGVDMMQYTKAYNSMGRLMTALDEAMDVLINRTGLVGR